VTVLHRQQTLGDRKPHAGARAAILDVRTAIEALEDVRQIGGGNARAAVADGDRQTLGV
jgi:hypothetical protein